MTCGGRAPAAASESDARNLAINNDMNTDQINTSGCEQCGAPLANRMMPCASCRARSTPSYGAMVPTLTVRLNETRPLPPRRLPARRVWSPSRALANPYATIEEAVVVQSAYRRLREPLVLAASALVVASAVYAGFIHSSDERVEGEPVAVSGAVKRPSVAPPVVAMERLAAVSSVRSAAEVAAPRGEPAPTPSVAVAAASPASSSTSLPAASPARASASPSLAARRAASAAPVVSTAATPAATTIAIASAQPKPVPSAPPPLTAEEKARADLSRHLRAARASLQNNNLSATKVRVAAAMVVQPQSREAQNLRAAINTREQQRDALLSLARGCGYIARWDCVSRNAGSALEIDSSSREARHLVTLAMQESALASVQAVESEPSPAPDTRDINAHH